MTAVYIVLALLFLFVLLLFSPVSAYFFADGEVKYKFYIFGIKVFDSEKKKTVKPENKKEKSKESKPTKKKKEKNSIEKLFLKEKEKNGTVGAIKFFAELSKAILSKLVWFIKTLKFKNIEADVFIGSENAAKTAVEYGVVCTAVYPLLSLITSNASVKYKSVNISADFNSSCVSGEVGFFVTARPIFAVLGFIKGYTEYKKLLKESEKNG